MKALLTLVMALSLSQAFAQQAAMGIGATTSGSITGQSTTAGSAVQNNTSTTVPTRNNGIGNGRNANTINNNNTTTDAVGNSQSATIKVLPNTPGTITPANTNATGVNCVDSSGRNYGNGDSGYTACVNSMRTR